jgi:hypothetical protein
VARRSWVVVVVVVVVVVAVMMGGGGGGVGEVVVVVVGDTHPTDSLPDASPHHDDALSSCPPNSLAREVDERLLGDVVVRERPVVLQVRAGVD